MIKAGLDVSSELSAPVCIDSFIHSFDSQITYIRVFSDYISDLCSLHFSRSPTKSRIEGVETSHLFMPRLNLLLLNSTGRRKETLMKCVSYHWNILVGVS